MRIVYKARNEGDRLPHIMVISHSSPYPSPADIFGREETESASFEIRSAIAMLMVRKKKKKNTSETKLTVAGHK